MSAKSDLSVHRPLPPAPGAPSSYQLFRHQNGVFGSQAQIVGNNPEPASLWIIAVPSHTHCQAILPGHADNVGRLSIPRAHIDWVGIERSLNPRDTGIGLELHP